MVHRPIYLGISMGVLYEKNALALSITINDGFFVLGTKDYDFPIVTGEGDASPGLSPQMSMPSGEDDDDEFEEVRGLYISIKKEVRLKEYSKKRLCKNKMERNVSPYASAKVRCHSGNGDSTHCFIGENVVSRLPKEIWDESLRDIKSQNEEILPFQYFDEDTLSVLEKVLLTAVDKWIGEYAKGNAIKIVGAGISTAVFLVGRLGDSLKKLLWFKYDVIPSFFSGGQKPLDQQSESLARKCANLFGQDSLPRLSIVEGNRVNVDAGKLWFCSLNDYGEIIGDKKNEFFSDLLKLNDKLSGDTVAFISSTPQGGGVALMRHSLLRFFQMVGLDASWYVCNPSPSVFSITKKKVHNILQGVAAEDTELTKEDMKKIDRWLVSNYTTHWKDVFRKATFVILDDHQVARLVPHIKKENPKTVVIYRSHIQILCERIAEQKSAADVWEYLWESLKDADYFVSHPIDAAVPKEVPPEMVVFQPAGTDPLDGLNKNLPEKTAAYYQNVFNRICLDNGETPVNFLGPYITQIARFDPSKGIPDLLQAYYALYKMHLTNRPNENFRIGLVICGHGSVDDPQATSIFRKISDLVNTEIFEPIRHLITKVRLPPFDQLLNVVLSSAKVCCQLSITEGYEVKVTESILKKVPVVVYRSGGLPLQVKNGKTGFIVEKGDTQEVARKLYDLMYDNDLYAKMRDQMDPNGSACITTPFQAMFWMKLMVTSKEKGRINRTSIYKEMEKKYLLPKTE